MPKVADLGVGLAVDPDQIDLLGDTTDRVLGSSASPARERGRHGLQIVAHHRANLGHHQLRVRDAFQAVGFDDQVGQDPVHALLHFVVETRTSRC